MVKDVGADDGLIAIKGLEALEKVGQGASTKIIIPSDLQGMNSDRIYRKSLKPSAIRSELAKGRGTQFDPELLNAFLKLFNKGILDDMQTISYHMLFDTTE